VKLVKADALKITSVGIFITVKGGVKEGNKVIARFYSCYNSIN
jgi:hypothetical protein